MVSDLNDSYWKDKFRGAGRYMEQTSTTVLGKVDTSL